LVLAFKDFSHSYRMFRNKCLLSSLKVVDTNKRSASS